MRPRTHTLTHTYTHIHTHTHTNILLRAQIIKHIKTNN